MDKEILKEYASMKKEVQDTQRRISELEEQLKKYDGNYIVQDSVAGGNGGKQHFHVAGFPYPEYSRKRTLLLKRLIRLESLRSRLENMIDDVEEYIDSIESSRMRLIIKMRYIDGITWRGIAKILGAGNNADSVRMEHERFINKREDNK